MRMRVPTDNRRYKTEPTSSCLKHDVLDRTALKRFLSAIYASHESYAYRGLLQFSEQEQLFQWVLAWSVVEDAISRDARVCWMRLISVRVTASAPGLKLAERAL